MKMMPAGVAKKTTGAAATISSDSHEVPQEELTAEDKERLKNEREEFDLQEEALTPLELNSWYGE